MPDGVRAQPYELQLTATGGTPPYTWSATGLPAGLRIEGDAVVGAPTAGGEATIDFTVQDAAGLTRSRTFTVFVQDPDIGGSIHPVSTDPTQLWAGLTSAVSDDGQMVAFTSPSAGLTDPPGQIGRYDVFIWDRVANTMRRVTDDSRSSYWDVGMSGDGSTVVFASDNPNLVPGDTNGTLDVLLVDTAGGPITRVSLGEGGGSSVGVSDDGQTVVYGQRQLDSAGNTQGRLVVWDRTTGTTTQVAEGNGEMFGFDLTDDGSRVAFLSWASDLVPGDTNEAVDVFAADVTSGAVTRIESGIGEQWGVSIAGDGTAVTFASTTTAFVPPGDADTNGGADVFRVDLGSLEVVRLTNGNGPSNAKPTISDDGRIIAFNSKATDLASGERDLDENDDVFLWNADTGLISRLTRSRGRPTYGAAFPVVSGDGRTVAFNSGASDLAPGATPVDGAFWYAYVWTRTN